MNNVMPSPKASVNSEKPDFVMPLKSVFFQYFEQLVDGCCTRIDLEFGLHLGKNREKLNKDLYLKLLEYLRSVRGDIKNNYLLKIDEIFDQIGQKKITRAVQKINLNTASFASDESVKEDLLKNQIIRHCQHKYREDLMHLNQLLAVLLAQTALHSSQNPVAPENLLEALSAVIKPLKLSPLHRAALYKTFDDNVFSQLGFIYRELITQCESLIKALKTETGDFVGGPNQEATAKEPASSEFLELQLKLEQWRRRHSPSSYDRLHEDCTLFFEHFEIKNALQVLGQFSLAGTLQPQTETQPLKGQVLKRLEELDFSDAIKTLASADEDSLDLISLIFARIAAHPYLSDAFKSVLAPLMIPMAAACLAQYTVFTSRDHPIRHMVDTLVAAGQFLNPDSPISRSLQDRITRIVTQLVTGAGFEVSGWNGAIAEIAQLLEKHRLNSQQLEESSIQAVVESEAFSSKRQEVLNLIDKAINNKNLPQTIINFLKNVWINAMINSYLIKDRQPELWEKSVRTMNELITSVTPIENSEHRKRVLKCIPEMIGELRLGLNRMAYDKALQSRFFKELAVLHVILLNKNEAGKNEAFIPKMDLALAGQRAPEPDQMNDCFSDQANRLKVGDWLVFHMADKSNWAKLARKSGNDQNLLFVDKNGEKTIQIGADALADLFRKGRTALAQPDSRRITDILLSEL